MKLFSKTILKNLKYKTTLISNNGFTVIELILTIFILSLLVTISLPSFKNLINQIKKDSYTNEFVSFIELAKRESRRYGMTCKIIINKNNNSNNKEGFLIDCSGSNDYTKKIYSMVPKLDKDLIQRVSNEINITPKGQIINPNNDSNKNFTIIIIVLKERLNRNFIIQPSCILINEPSGVISTGKYIINQNSIDYSIENEYIKDAKDFLCIQN